MPLRKANGAGMLIYDTLSHSLMPNNMFVNLLWLKFPCFVDSVISSCCLDARSYQGIANGFWSLSLGAGRNICIDNKIYNVYLYSDLWNFGSYMYMYFWGRTVGELIICDRDKFITSTVGNWCVSLLADLLLRLRLHDRVTVVIMSVPKFIVSLFCSDLGLIKRKTHKR